MSEQLTDKKGYPIHAGDVLRVYHFSDRRGRKWYMYKLAREIDGRLCGVSIHEIAEKGDKAHSFRLEWLRGQDCEIVEGYGPGKCVDFTERKRIKAQKVSA